MNVGATAPLTKPCTPGTLPDVAEERLPARCRPRAQGPRSKPCGSLSIGTNSVLGAVVAGIPSGARARGDATTAPGPGDVNGDGSLDVSDAVYLLVHLFRGGPAPVACAESPELIGRVLDLGARLSSLEVDSAAAKASLESFVLELPERTRDTALLAQAITAVFEAECANETLRYKRGPGRFRLGTTGDARPLLRRGEIADGALRFETAWLSDLLVEFTYRGPRGYGSHDVCLLLDGLYVACSASPVNDPSFEPEGIAHEVFLDVPPGEHYLTVEGSITCTSGTHV
jgi:hypothetical protein